MTDLERRVLDKLAEQDLSPRPFAYFLAGRTLLWLAFAASILLGSVATATILYAVTDQWQAGGRNFDEMPFDDIFEVLPFAWLTVLALLLAGAIVSFRRTPRGHRHGPLKVGAAAVAASAVLGALLFYFDVGRSTHHALLRSIPVYYRLVHSREDQWRRPAAGQIGGGVLGLWPGGALLLRGFDGRDWTIDTSQAVILLDEPLGSEEIVAVRGVRTGPSSFRASSVEEWD